MAKLAREAIEAGALGFSTSRTINHKANDGTLTYSYSAASDELAGIARGVAESGKGVLQFISDFDDLDSEFGIVERMVAESRAAAVAVAAAKLAPSRWLARRARQGRAGTRRGRADPRADRGRPVGLIVGLAFSRHPFMACPSYLEVATSNCPSGWSRCAIRPARRAFLRSRRAPSTK